MANLIAARKALPVTPNTKMKQLQWDKLPQQQVGRTVFNEEESMKEQEWVKKLQMENVWMEMEEDFKAKQLVINLMGTYFVKSSVTHGSEFLSSQAEAS